MFNSIWDCKQLIEEQLIDYIRTTVVHAGGITHLRRIADFAEPDQVRTGCHGATDLSPVCMAAALHLDLCGAELRHPGIHAPQPRNRCGLPARLPLRGRLPDPGERSGLGVDIDEKLAAKYPYGAPILPVNRLRRRHDVELVARGDQR